MIIERKQISELCEQLRNEGKKLVFTNGCFDIIHAGHVYYLTEAKKLGDVLIVGLNTDDSVRRLKGHSRPINGEQDRAVVLNALKPVDYVVLFDEDTPIELIKQVRPDFLVKGADYERKNIVGADFVESYGGRVATIEFVEGKSTTNIINKMKTGDEN
ncbi:MAG: D-glycero-beta-D-manno-heptose 1-phosphate adenylyltransferase [Ignavibacteria bacterium]|nr:D-glycero-beta-D-manno-heptose 1-phosphate adenylyltransferase [Ignavibacteria bacterium]